MSEGEGLELEDELEEEDALEGNLEREALGEEVEE